MRCSKCHKPLANVEGAATRLDQCEGCFTATLNSTGKDLASVRSRGPVQTSRAQLYRDFTRSTSMPRLW